MIEPKPTLRLEWSAVIHGGTDPTELARAGLDPEALIDFSANVNPFGPSPAVLRAIRDAALSRYPDRECCRLRAMLAKRHGVDADAVLVGNGSVELIYLLAAAYVSVGEQVLILGPTFAEYERASRLHGAEVTVVSASPDTGFAPPLDEFANRLASDRPKLVFVNTPNNPTGQVVPSLAVRRLAACHRDSLWVVDEAYCDCLDETLAERDRECSAYPSNVVRLRSLTKAHGLAGLRLGYALADAHILAPLRTLQPPWSVNSLAQSAGLAALADQAHLRHTRQSWHAAKRQLVESLRRIGLAPVASAVPFFLLPVYHAAQIRCELLHRGLLVRDASSFGLPGYLRICAGQPTDNQKLTAALAELYVNDELHTNKPLCANNGLHGRAAFPAHGEVR